MGLTQDTGRETCCVVTASPSARQFCVFTVIYSKIAEVKDVEILVHYKTDHVLVRLPELRRSGFPLQWARYSGEPFAYRRKCNHAGKNPDLNSAITFINNI